MPNKAYANSHVILTLPIVESIIKIDSRIKGKKKGNKGHVSAFGIENENRLTGAYLMIEKKLLFTPFKKGLDNKTLKGTCNGLWSPPLYKWVKGLSESGQMIIDESFIDGYRQWVYEQGGPSVFNANLSHALFDWEGASSVDIDDFNRAVRNNLINIRVREPRVTQTGEPPSLPTMQVLESHPFTQGQVDVPVAGVTTSQPTLTPASLPPPLPNRSPSRLQFFSPEFSGRQGSPPLLWGDDEYNDLPDDLNGTFSPLPL